MQENSLLFFVKYPEAGRVKTRVGKVIGYQESALLYKTLAEHNFREISRLRPGVEIIVAYDPEEAKEEFQNWLPAANIYLPQKGVALGKRLMHALQFAFERGAKRAIALGSDTINLKSEVIEKGFEILRDKNAVIGPAKDGGYYLIGLSTFEPEVFDNVAWSSSQTMRQTIENLNRRRFSYSLLEELEDFDQPEQADQIRLAFETAGKD